MRIEYRHTFKDAVLFHALHQFLSPLMQGVFLLVAALIFISELGEGPVWKAAGTAASLYVVMWLLQFLFNALFVFSKNNRTLFTHHVVEIRDDGLHEETAFNRSVFYWPGVVKAVSRPGFAAVYVAAHNAHIIPARAFASSAEKHLFVTQVEERIRASASEA
jgi:hypothetical protein